MIIRVLIVLHFGEIIFTFQRDVRNLYMNVHEKRRDGKELGVRELCPLRTCGSKRE